MTRTFSSGASQRQHSPDSKEDLRRMPLERERHAKYHPSSREWGLAGVLLFLVSVISLMFFERSFAYVDVFFILSFLVAWQCLLIFWARGKIISFLDILIEIVELPLAEIEKWYEHQEMRIFHDRRMFLAGFAMILISHSLGLDNNGISFQSPLPNALLYAYYHMGAFTVGIGLYTVLMTGLMVHQIGRLPLDINIIISRKIQSIGVLYSQFTICAASVYIGWGIFHMLTPEQFSSFKKIFWFAFFGLLLILYFILPQYGIHRMIIETKKQKVNTFSQKMRNVAEKAFADPVRENISCLRSMFDIQRQLDEMSEWPFGSYEVVHISLIVIIPLIVVLLEVMLGIVR
jgi:hypothetical protein